MRAAEASHFAKKFDDDDGALLKPQWLQRTSGAGISNQFRSADQFRGRGGRKFGGDDRRPRGPSPKVSSPASSDFPPLAPFYRSHSTGSLTPADIPSASSRLLSASKEEKTFSINRECDFPTLATAAAVVEQPARMHKSKSATALPQAISPSSDLLKAHHTTLAALAGPAVSSAPPPSAASSPALAPAVTGPEPVAPAKQTHKKKPSFSDKVSFSEIAATEKAASNKDKFQQTMANSRAELQRFKSLVPSKPVHPSLANRPSIRPFQSKVRPKMPVPTASATVLKAPDTNLMTMIPPTSPATMRKATSAPVLPMSTTLLPRSPPNPSPLSTICTSSSTPSSSSSSSSRDSAHHPAAAAAPSSPPRPALLSSSQSARTLPQASSASSSSDAWADETGFAPRQSFALPLASSRFSFANGTSAGGSTVSPRRRDSSPATSTCVNGSSSSSPCSSSAASPLTSPRRSSVASVMAFVQQDSDAMIGTMGIYSSSAPLSPRMATVGSSGGSSGGNALTSSSGGKTGKKPLRHSGSASSKPASNGGTRQRRRSVKSSNSSSSTNGGSRRQSADDGEPAAAANGQATVNGLGIAHYQASTCDNTASSSGSSDNASDDDQGLMLEAEYDRVNDDELMMIATGVTSITATSIAGVHLEPCLPPDDDVADRQSSQSAINGEAGGLSSLKDEFCPFSWEMRADGEEWSEFSEEAVSGFMKTLGYEAQDGGARGLDDDDDDGEGLTEEEIRLAKQQIERATLQQLLEKKKQGLSESLKNWQPPLIPGSPAAAPSAGSALASSSSSSPSSSSSSSPSSSSTSPTLLRHHPRPVASLSASSAGGGRRGHHQPLRSSSGPTPPSSSSSHGRRNLQHSHSHSQQQQQQQLRQDLLALVDSDSDESDCEEEVHGFHGIVFG